MSEHSSTSRCAIVAGVLLVTLVVLGTRVGMLHLAPGEGVREKLIKLRTVQQTLSVRRGSIVDRNGERNLLALDLDVKHVCVDPKKIADGDLVDETVAALSRHLEVAPDLLLSRIDRPSRRFEYLEKYVMADRAEAINELGLTGVFFRNATMRYYPHDGFMCHVLGFTNHQGDGSAGVEQRLDRFLRGEPGSQTAEVDGLRVTRYDRRSDYEAPEDGANVVLTLDQNVQYMAEKALDAAMEEHGAEAAWVIMQRVATGEILAMASRPGYSLNGFRTAEKQHMLNRTIGQNYEPGSTMKVVPVAAALNEGLLNVESQIDCENGYWMHARRPLRDHHGYSMLSVADIVKKSSNIGTAKIALMLGDDRLHAYMRAFGLGQQTGIDLPGEERGILHPVRRWSAISSSRLSIGQGVAVTALQMLNVYCCLANDGKLMRPYVVDRVVEADGHVRVQNRPEMVRQVVSAHTAWLMRTMLARVCEPGGTGTRARIEDVTVGGKTGTAQKPVAGGYSDTDYYASFVGVFPIERPEVGMIVVVDNPQPVHTGGRVAGPVFKEIGEQAARYLDVRGNRPDSGATVAYNR